MLPVIWELQISMELRKLHFLINSASPVILQTLELTTHHSHRKKVVGWNSHNEMQVPTLCISFRDVLQQMKKNKSISGE